MHVAPWVSAWLPLFNLWIALGWNCDFICFSNITGQLQVFLFCLCLSAYYRVTQLFKFTSEVCMHLFLLIVNRKKSSLSDGVKLRIAFTHMARKILVSKLFLMLELKSPFELSRPDWTASWKTKSLIMLFLGTYLVLRTMTDANQRVHKALIYNDTISLRSQVWNRNSSYRHNNSLFLIRLWDKA